MPSIFTRIIAGELPSQTVWRDDRAVALLSINPISRGHALVVPIDEVDHWLDLEPALNAHLVQVAQVIGTAQMAAFRPRRIGLMIAGFEVPHVHLHTLPIADLSDLSFAKAASSVPPEELAAAADALRAELRALGRAEVVA